MEDELIASNGNVLTYDLLMEMHEKLKERSVIYVPSAREDLFTQLHNDYKRDKFQQEYMSSLTTEKKIRSTRTIYIR